MYVGHKRENGSLQPLAAHLREASQLARGFAAPFGAAEHAARTALLHDVGKYGDAQQHRMLNPQTTAKVDHSTAGTQEAFRLNDPMAAFAICGHHGGMPDMGNRIAPEEGTLMARRTKTIARDYDHWREDGIQFQMGNLCPAWLINGCVKSELPFAQSFYTRMLYSTLVDADYLDTEAFMAGDQVDRGHFKSVSALLADLEAMIEQRGMLRPTKRINEYRAAVLTRCLDGGKDQRGLYTLTVPTGGGKTISSIAYALSHAVRHKQDRIIYVIPYTSIIEQTARVFASIFGEDNVIQHHSAVEYDAADEESGYAQKMRYASENWDAPVIVTTSVQFFESLFAAKPSKCRKLHHIANSVIIFDEAQMLPQDYLLPCVNAIAELVKHYHTTAVLCTATQPALNPLLADAGCTPVEIVDNTAALYNALRRTVYRQESAVPTLDLVRRLNESQQVLCIVNNRKYAQEIFDGLDDEGRFYLSTLITPNDRHRILDEVRSRLAAGQVCRLVSTSLIEAGVDVDFPAVWRQEAGLDSILQAGGRCNREGRRSPSDSIVHVFRGEAKPPQMLNKAISSTQLTTERHAEIDTQEAIHDYFTFLLKLRGESIDRKRVMDLCKEFAFRTIGQRFKLIESDTVTIYVPTEQNHELLDNLRKGDLTRSQSRRLSRDSVQIYPQQYQTMLEVGKLENVIPGEMAILVDEGSYSHDRGLSVSGEQVLLML